MVASAGPWLLAIVVIGGALILAPRILARLGLSWRVAGGLRKAGRGREIDLERASAYHRLLPVERRVESVDDRTWADLDLDAVFVATDRTTSETGRQYLYHLLRSPHSDIGRLKRLERLVAETRRADVAEPLGALLRRLDDPRAANLVELLYGELPRRPRLWLALPLLSAASLVLLALFATGSWPAAALPWLGVCVANVLVQLGYRPRVRQFVPALHELSAFLDATRTLAALPVETLADERRALAAADRELRALRRATSWLRFEPGQANEVLASVYEYVNLALLLDVNAFVFALDVLRARRDTMRRAFDAIGLVDAARSIAAWRESLPRCAVPAFTAPQSPLRVEGLVHPLVTDAVPNAIAIDSRSVLVSGSNMSGKSTFVRALGVNAVLAQSLHTVTAARWEGPPLRIRTSIGRADSVTEGKSYYLAEAEAVRELVRASEDSRQHLFLLDEIFRGTNTSERVAAGFAVLSWLARRPHRVVVATHDLELLPLLGDHYEAYHFREQVERGTLRFDYRLHPGPSSTRNAIALLEVLRYPPELVAEARRVVR